MLDIFLKGENAFNQELNRVLEEVEKIIFKERIMFLKKSDIFAMDSDKRVRNQLRNEILKELDQLKKGGK